MAKLQLTSFLAALAVACAVTALVVLAIAALRTGEPHLETFIPIFIIALGAGARLRKSRLSRA